MEEIAITKIKSSKESDQKIERHDNNYNNKSKHLYL
jgi:hypothetical protein